MNSTQQSSLCALQFKTIDGLQIRFATNGEEGGEPVLLLSPLPESILALTKYKLPDFAMHDYLASYAGSRFWDAVEFVRAYPQSLPRLAKRLPEIATPCQITVGRYDPFVPVSNAEGLRRGLPKSNLTILECGHFVWEDAAAEYAKLACDFIQGGDAKL
jgi:pimeloyl-ACP methyl ester carboxylesterase